MRGLSLHQIGDKYSEKLKNIMQMNERTSYTWARFIWNNVAQTLNASKGDKYKQHC